MFTGSPPPAIVDIVIGLGRHGTREGQSQKKRSAGRRISNPPTPFTGKFTLGSGTYDSSLRQGVLSFNGANDAIS